MILLNIKQLLYGFYVTLAWILSIDENIIQIYYDKNFKLFYHNFINIILETWSYIK